jgi:hypothetical protein
MFLFKKKKEYETVREFLNHKDSNKKYHVIDIHGTDIHRLPGRVLLDKFVVVYCAREADEETGLTKLWIKSAT